MAGRFVATRRPGFRLRGRSVLAGLGLAAALAGCDQLPEPQAPPQPDVPAFDAKRYHKRPKDLPPADWRTFPGVARGSRPPLQDLYAGIALALSELDDDRDALCAGDTAWRKQRVREAIAPAVPFLGDTWAAVAKAYPEAAELELAVRTQLDGAFMPDASLPHALAWLAAEVVDGAFCTKPFEVKHVALSLVAWSTTPEGVYQSAFETFGLAWTGIRDSKTNPWAEQSAAVQALKKWMFVPAAGDVPATVRGIDLSAGATGPIVLQVSSGNDRGWAGRDNRRVDTGEVIDLNVRIEARTRGEALLSESVVPMEIPACMVVAWDEVVLPELRPGTSGEVTLPDIFVSSRCSSREILKVKAISSATAQSTAIDIEFRPSTVNLAFSVPAFDVDLPGFSDVGDARKGLAPGMKVELSPIAEATAGLIATVRWVRTAERADAPLIAIQPFAPFALRLDPRDGKLHGEDDLDVAPSDARKLRTTLAGRSASNAFTVDPSALWLVVDVEGEVPSQRGTLSAQDTKSGALAGRKTAGRGVPTKAAASALDPAAALALLTAQLSPGKSPRGVRRAIVEQLQQRAGAVAVALTWDGILDPQMDPTVAEFGTLVELGAVPAPTVRTVYDYFDRQRAARSRDPEARRISRQIRIVKLFLDSLPPDVAKATLKRVDLLALDTATPLDALLRALVPVLIQHELGALRPLPDGPGLRTLIEQLLRATEGGDAPTDPGNPYSFRRFWRLALRSKVK